MSKRKYCLKDVFWIRITLLDDPAFPPGAPWRMAPQVFERLEIAGLVEKRIAASGAESAVGTDLAREQIECLRRARVARMPGEGRATIEREGAP